MTPTVQPKAVFGQQPKAVIQLNKIRGVTSTAKLQAKTAFAKRLHAILDAKRWEKRGRPGKLRELLARNGVHVEYETPRSWLAGEKLPATAHIQILCGLIGANSSYLEHGAGDMFTTDPLDQDLAEIQRSWATLEQKGRDHVMTALSLAIQAQSSPQAHPKPKRQEVQRDEGTHTNRRRTAGN